MMSVIDELLSYNERYAESYRNAGLTARPKRGVAVVACKDARIIIAKAFGLAEGDGHVIRNAGAVITDDIVRSLVISQHILETKEIMVVAHTRCGMMTFTDDDLRERVRGSSGSDLAFPIGTFTDLEKHVSTGVRKLRACELLLHRDSIRGFVYDVDTGRAREIHVS